MCINTSIDRLLVDVAVSSLLTESEAHAETNKDRTEKTIGKTMLRKEEKKTKTTKKNKMPRMGYCSFLNDVYYTQTNTHTNARNK